MEIVEHTKSTCSKCLKPVDAQVVKEAQAIYLQKSCDEHGDEKILLSNYSQAYAQLREFYFSIMPKKIPQSTYMLYLTDQCNLACPICDAQFKAGDILDMTIEDVKLLINKYPKAEFFICGAEPSMHSDLLNIIRLLKKHQGYVLLYSNGLTLENEFFVREMKKAGLSKLFLSFDGFDPKSYKVLRGKMLLEKKLEIFNILKRNAIPVVLCSVLMKGINDNQVKALFDYVLDNDFVCELDLVPYLLAGNSSDYLTDSFFMPHAVIHLLEEATEGKLKKESIFLFQKFFYASMAFLNRRTCFAYTSFWIYRKGVKEFIPIDVLLSLQKFEKRLDSYVLLFNRNVFLGRSYFAYILFCIFFRFCCNYPRIIFELISLLFVLLVKKGGSQKSRLIKLLLSSCCDPVKMDFNIGTYCSAGMIWKDADTSIRLVDNLWEYILEKETQKKKDKL